MHRKIGAALAIATLAVSSPALCDPVLATVSGTAREIYKNSFALIIAQSKYRTWQELPSVPDEAVRIHDALIRQGFNSSAIITAHDVDSANFYPLLQSFIASHGGADARLIIYYAGHGASNATGETGYLIPVDAPKQEAPGFLAKAVPLPVFKATILGSTALHTLVVFDSCFSGMIFSTRGNVGHVKFVPQRLEDYQRPRIQVITSGDADQVVPGDSEFADAFIRGMDGAARFEDSPIITADDLASYLSHNVTETTVRGGSMGKETGGEFMFAVQTDEQNSRSKQSDIINKKGGAVFASTTVSGWETQKNHYKKMSTPSSDDKNVNIISQNEDIKSTKQLSTASEGSDVDVPPPSTQTLRVRYFKKAADGLVVVRALDASGFAYVARAPTVPDRFPVNALACSTGSDFTQVKHLAIGLVEKGVPIRMLYSFKRGDTSRDVAEIVTYRISENRELDTPVLTVGEITRLQSCPTYLWHGQPNKNDPPKVEQ